MVILIGKIALNIIMVAFVFGMLIFIHEFGHFLIAKKKKVKVEKFSLGFGKKLIGFKRAETEYTISIFPLGGYVKMAGDEPGRTEGKPWEFLTQPPGQRCGIVIAGPIMNLLLAFLLMVTSLMIGIREANFSNEIGSIEESSPAEMAGMKPGDRIISIDGNNTDDWHAINEVLTKVRQDKHSAVEIAVLRNEKKISFGEIPFEENLGITPFISTEIGSVMIGLPAYRVGLKRGDRIIAVDGRKVGQWQELAGAIHAHPDEELELKVERDDEVFLVRVKSISQEVLGFGPHGLIGIRPHTPMSYIIRFGPLKSIHYGALSTVYQVGQSYKALWLLLAHPGHFKEYVGGPILIAQMATNQAQEGVGHFLRFIAVINIWLMVVNLLPIPVLDGGHVIFCIVESIRRKPLTEKTQQLLQRLGLTIIVALMAFAFINDTLRAVDRTRALRQSVTKGGAIP